MITRFRLALLGLALPLLLAACGAPPASSWPGLSTDGQQAFIAYGTHVYAIDLDSAKQAWAHPVEAGAGEQFYSNPGVGDGVIVAGSQGTLSQFHGVLYGLGEDGRQKWCLAFDSVAGDRTGCPTTPEAPQAINLLFINVLPAVDNRLIGGVTVAGDTAYFGMANDNFYAVDVDTGRHKWTFTTGGSIWAAPLVTDGLIYAASLDHFVYAINRETGRETWSTDLGAGIGGPPAELDGTLLVGTFGNEVVALDALTGDKRWSFPTENWVWGGIAVRDGLAYFADLSGNLYAVDVAGGTQVWRQTLAGQIRSAPALDGDALYIGDLDGNLYARRVSDGGELWTRQIEGQLLTTPVVVAEKNQVLIAVHQGKNLLERYGLDGALLQPWAPSQ